MIQTLIDRLSKLDAPDREVDALIVKQFGLENECPYWLHRFTRSTPMHLTASIDAVIALARSLWPDVMYRVGNDGEGPDPSLYLGELFIPGEQKDSYFTGLSPVDAVSLCIALLRAKEASNA